MTDVRNDFAPGVITGSAVQDVFALAKAEGFALPACNVTGTNTMNGVMEAAAEVNAPVIEDGNVGRDDAKTLSHFERNELPASLVSSHRRSSGKDREHAGRETGAVLRLRPHVRADQIEAHRRLVHLGVDDGAVHIARAGEQQRVGSALWGSLPQHLQF